MKKVRAYANIALIKYWGKQDEKLNLPYYNTVSVTLDAFYTDVKIDINKDSKYLISGVENDKSNKFLRLEKHIELLNKSFNLNNNYYINTNNNFPMGVGLASSASSYAAITYAYFLINNLSIDFKEISKWARMGSGSATRSLHGGFVKWEKGNDHNSSFACKVLNDWDEFRVVVVNLDKNEKTVSSREAMKRAITLEEYNCYVKRSVIMYNNLMESLLAKNFSEVGMIAEKNAIMMHELINKTNINYLSNDALKLFELAKDLRNKNIETYITADAGDTVCFLVLEKDLDNLLFELKDYETTISKVEGKAHEL